MARTAATGTAKHKKPRVGTPLLPQVLSKELEKWSGQDSGWRPQQEPNPLRPNTGP